MRILIIAVILLIGCNEDREIAANYGLDVIPIADVGFGSIVYRFTDGDNVCYYNSVGISCLKDKSK